MLEIDAAASFFSAAIVPQSPTVYGVPSSDRHPLTARPSYHDPPSSPAIKSPCLSVLLDVQYAASTQPSTYPTCPAANGVSPCCSGDSGVVAVCAWSLVLPFPILITKLAGLKPNTRERRGCYFRTFTIGGTSTFLRCLDRATSLICLHFGIVVGQRNLLKSSIR